MQQRTHSGKHTLFSVYTKYPEEQHDMQQMEKHNRVAYTLALQRFKSSIYLSKSKMRTFLGADTTSDDDDEAQTENLQKEQEPTHQI